MMEAVLVNGEPVDRISVYDRGFQYGDGVFETLAVRQGQPLLWEAHVERMITGAERLGIQAPSLAAIREEALRLCRDVTAGVLKIVLTRGISGRGYGYDSDSVPNRVVSLGPWPSDPGDYAQAGAVVRLCHTTLGRNPVLAGIKHLNRLEQVLARAECGTGYAEGLMRDETGAVIEGTMSNVFVVSRGALCTPDLGACGVAGIMRACVLREAPRLGLMHCVRELTCEDLLDATEVFLTNSLIGVQPVRKIDGFAADPHDKEYGIGPITRKVRRAIHASYFCDQGAQ